MNKLINIIITIVFGISFTSCEIGGCPDHFSGTFVVKNDSTHTITLSGNIFTYVPNDDTIDDIILCPNETVTRFEFDTPGPSFFPYDIIVVFDNEISIIHSRSTCVLHSLLEDSSDAIKSKRSGRAYTYTFTDADYDYAVQWNEEHGGE